MKVYTFIADTAPEAVAQIREQLGSEAVVLNVRKVEGEGISKIWKKPKIEVLAHLPEAVAVEASPDPLHALSELRREIADLRQQMPVARPEPASIIVEPTLASRIDYKTWKVGSVLEQAGVLPRNVQRIIDQVEADFGEEAPQEFSKQFDLARAAMSKLSQNLSRLAGSIPTENRTHIFVGAPGCGKTTVLSKRLAQVVLMENAPARVLRLDGARANTAESLSVYCEILGVEVDRCLQNFSPVSGMTFVDLPGVSANDADGLRALGAQLVSFPGAQIHLVLNAAYETSTLLGQLRAFSSLPITDLVFTHLDEEPRWGKLLNFCFGTKFPIAFLSAGQNVPGELTVATTEKILSRVIPSK